MSHRIHGRSTFNLFVISLILLVASPGLAKTSGVPATAIARLSVEKERTLHQVYFRGAQVGYSVQQAVTPPLRSLGLNSPPPGPEPHRELENRLLPRSHRGSQPDPVVQRAPGSGGQMPEPSINFLGISQMDSGCACTLPDTNGDVGQTQYVQMVNSAFQVFDKNGTSLYGPASINTLWHGMEGPCATPNDGNPIVLYDSMANRWLMSQLTAESPYNECIAISASDDALGNWYAYAFELDTLGVPDQPRLGVWPDGYYMTVNIFNGDGIYAGPQAYVFNRSKMLRGQPPNTYQTFSLVDPDVYYAPILPADLDGPKLPPAGAPNYLVGYGDPMNLYKFHVDWSSPENSTFTNTSLDLANFTELCSTVPECVPQQGTAQRLDGLGTQLMPRLAYRNFGDHESMVVNHSVDVGEGQAGIRWYEIRDPGSFPSVYQQGSYAPDAQYRWVGSVAMDRVGNLAVGYSVSSSTLYPSIRYAGRLATDPLSTLSQGETTLINGSGSQVGSARWGAYSAMMIDPVDDCTFWYTNEYYTANGSNWQTRVGAFKFPSCDHRVLLPVLLENGD